jgi:hypothetical protein
MASAANCSTNNDYGASLGKSLEYAQWHTRLPRPAT